MILLMIIEIPINEKDLIVLLVIPLWLTSFQAIFFYFANSYKKRNNCKSSQIPEMGWIVFKLREQTTKLWIQIKYYDHKRTQYLFCD